MGRGASWPGRWRLAERRLAVWMVWARGLCAGPYLRPVYDMVSVSKPERPPPSRGLRGTATCSLVRILHRSLPALAPVKERTHRTNSPSAPTIQGQGPVLKSHQMKASELFPAPCREAMNLASSPGHPRAFTALLFQFLDAELCSASHWILPSKVRIQYKLFTYYSFSAPGQTSALSFRSD